MKRFSPALLVATLSALVQGPVAYAAYTEDVLADKPVAIWDFNKASEGQVPAAGAFSGPAIFKGKVPLVPGPRPSSYPAFGKENKAVAIGKGSWLRVTDPGEKSPLDFHLGETITLEAWVSPTEIRNGENIYIVGKGRTKSGAKNQNYALRLRCLDGNGRVSFVFRDSRNDPKVGEEQWHRWTSKTGISPGSGWHHVAVSYTFGKPDSIRGYIDGVEVHGGWDMGGPTELGPVVDDDELWIGSSMAGSSGSTFKGSIDEVAIYRGEISRERLASRYVFTGDVPAVALADLPKDAIRVEILERLKKPKPEDLIAEANSGGNDAATTGEPVNPIDASWATPPDVLSETYQENAFGFATVPNKYSERGIRIDRSSPFMIRASGAITLPPGEHRLLLRALGGARLAIDGRIVTTTKFITRRYSDNEEVPDQTAQMLVSGVRVLPAGHSEGLATVKGDGKPHVITLEALVGGKNLRPETGELSVSISTNGGPFRLLTPRADDHTPLSDDGWAAYRRSQQDRIVQLEMQRRRNEKEDAYWAKRHELARQVASQKPAPTVPANPESLPANNEIDRFINVRLAKAGVAPAALTDDAAFLRRLTLDLAGVIPTPEEMQNFLAAPAAERRAQAIDRLLKDNRWADAWMPYWQDVLAENPALLKATLNNTGPFRFWLHEALLDNKPMDRFVTELISMDGSVYYGGPAGFGVASQNDVPMAAKAQILTTAFLGAEMQCARCHDAPSHPFNQEDLFGIAAMLQRGPIKVPITSSVPGLSPDSHVTVTLKTGTAVDPHWPLSEFPAEPLPGLQRNPDDSRERLAAILTDPRNERFAQVVVNRIWKQLFGWGLVEPVGDWDVARPSHPELIRWLAHQFISHGYDLKHVTRLIVSSQAYQRVATPEGSKAQKPDDRLFQSPARRRMTAEQLVDSLFGAAGKEFDTEELNFDTDARRSVRDFSNFGRPRRAWQFVPMSNERDRPALALPRAQTILDVLTVYGWRESRPEPKSTRDHEANVLQSAALANGIMGARITRLSDDSAFTHLSTEDVPVEQLVEKLFVRVLSRVPTPEERATFAEALTPGFAERRLPFDPKAAPRKAKPAIAVSWSNHLNAGATRIKLELEKETRAGDPPTVRLTTTWRERMEDAVWALMLTPEFIFIP